MDVFAVYRREWSSLGDREERRCDGEETGGMRS